MTTQKSEKTKITAKTGELFQIRVWEDRTKGGCRWVPTYDTAVLRLLGDEYERTRNIRVTDSGMRTFEFVGMAPAETEITFEARYGWKFSAEQHMTYDVSITDHT
ncbi:MAG: protease inhibitor I42 family protein [Nitrospiria bacterium]